MWGIELMPMAIAEHTPERHVAHEPRNVFPATEKPEQIPHSGKRRFQALG
jgi:hypothetical protein